MQVWWCAICFVLPLSAWQTGVGLAQQSPFDLVDRGIPQEFYEQLSEARNSLPAHKRPSFYSDLLAKRKGCQDIDVICQAEIVTIMESWFFDSQAGRAKGYDESFMHHHANLWFKTNKKRPQVIVIVALSYKEGSYGFPRDIEMAKCWADTINLKPRKTVEDCKKLEMKKYGKVNPIVKDP
jgi:hypothetical protein